MTTALTAGAGLLAVYAAAVTAWLCDDAFIGFRYADHLASGFGLVFNPGERVEGFSGPPWVLWLALGARLGVALERWAIGSGLAALAGCFVLLLVAERRRIVGAPRAAAPPPRDPPAPGPGPGLVARFGGLASAMPVSALLLLACDEWSTWATGGLETSVVLALVLWVGLRITGRRWETVGAASVTGAVAGLAMWARPELPALVLGLLVIATIAGPRRRLAWVWGLAVAPTLLWLGFRLGYYGDWLPNTYYARGADQPWWSQGWRWAGLFARQHLAMLAIFALGLVAWGRAPKARLLGIGGPTLAAVLHTLAVVRGGGDFMHARLLLPVLPLALVVWSDLTRDDPGEPPAGGWRHAGLGAVGLVLAAWQASSPSPFRNALDWHHGVQDESMFYDPEQELFQQLRGTGLAIAFRGVPVRVAFSAPQAREIYVSRVSYALELEAGLTDRALARRPGHRRRRIGHGKGASWHELAVERQIHLLVGSERLVPDLDESIPIVPAYYPGGGVARVLRYDPPLIEALRRNRVVVPPVEVVLAAELRALQGRDPARVRAAMARWDRFYLRWHPDPAIEAQLAAALAAAAAAESGGL